MTALAGYRPAVLRNVLTAGAIALLTILSFVWFPGHTILQSDTQIYIPILEHIENPGVLTADPMAVRPHVAFTIYDEVTLGLRALTGFGFEGLLQTQQLIFRGLGILGLFLLARAAGLSVLMSLAAAALVSLGATVNGPAVLTVEYEPVPRGFALPLVLLAIGLLASGRSNLASAAAALAVAFHPPTAVPVWLILAGIAAWKRQWRDIGILATGPVLLVLSAIGQPVSPEHPGLFTRIDPALESIQRMRTSYNWVDTWIGRYWLHYSLLFAASMAGAWRLWHTLPHRVRWFFVALPVIGCFSVPASWLLLERMKWIVTPQYQPGRYLVFITLFAALGCSIAGLRAAGAGRRLEAALFLFLPFAIPLEPDLLQLSGTRLLLALGLTVAAALAQRGELSLTVALLAFALCPTAGRVENFTRVMTPELDNLIEWARSSTPPDSVFQFADVRRGLEPGVLRSRAQRAIYADWKAGGQVNFMPSFARIWADRWKQVERPQSLLRYRELGIDFVVFRSGKAPKNAKPVFRNAAWTVFRTGH
jgi:hypothetical protein